MKIYVGEGTDGMGTITVRQFDMVVRATIEAKLKRSIMVLGPTGVGKSELVHQIAKDYDMPVIDVRLLLWALTDLKGIPYPDDTNTYTKWLVNDVLPREERDGKRGILLLEELNAAPKNVQAAAYQLTLDRKIGNYSLPDGWIIIATGNREQDNGVYIAPPAPLADRFEIHEVEVSFSVWRDYAIKAGYNPVVVSYLTANPTALYTFKEDDTAELVFATPRSWAAVGDLLDVGLKGEILEVKLGGNIGDVQAVAFLKYMENTELLPDIDAILTGMYVGNKMATAYMANIDVYYLLLQNLIYRVGAEFRQDTELWRSYVDNSVDFITAVKNFPIDLRKSYVDQLCEMDAKLNEYVYSGSRCQAVSKLLQELDYIKA